MQEALLDTLQHIGLTQGESKVYLALLSVGTSSVGPVIDKSGVSASKVYVILDKLMEKGLVSVVIEKKVKLFTASEPEQLIEYIDEQKRKLEQHKHETQAILPQLKAKKDSQTSLPVVEMARGERGFLGFYSRQIASAYDDDYVCIAGSRMSFRLQQHWFDASIKLSENKNEQFMVYEYDGWYKKDPSVHRREKRKLFYPVVLKPGIRDLPGIMCVANTTLLHDEDEEGLFSLIIRNKQLTNAFKKLIKLVRTTGDVPEGYIDKTFFVD